MNPDDPMTVAILMAISDVIAAEATKTMLMMRAFVNKGIVTEDEVMQAAAAIHGLSEDFVNETIRKMAGNLQSRIAIHYQEELARRGPLWIRPSSKGAPNAVKIITRLPHFGTSSFGLLLS